MAFSDLTNRLSQPALKETAEKGLRAMQRLKNMSLAMREQAGQTIQTLEVNAASFGWGFARGYFAEPGKDLSILGIPMDAAAGVAGHALALFGNLGKYSEDFHNLADGSLASYTTTLGLKLGVEQKMKAPAGAAPAAAAGGGMSVEELVRRAASAV
jgi:hypothetical protein